MRPGHDYLQDSPEPGDWQDVVARCLAALRQKVDGPGGNEYYEAAEIGDALRGAGYALVKSEVPS